MQSLLQELTKVLLLDQYNYRWRFVLICSDRWWNCKVSKQASKLLNSAQCVVNRLIIWPGVNELRAMYVIEAGEEVTRFSLNFAIFSQVKICVLLKADDQVARCHCFRWTSTTSPWQRRAGKWGKWGRSTSGKWLTLLLCCWILHLFR